MAFQFEVLNVLLPGKAIVYGDTKELDTIDVKGQ